MHYIFLFFLFFLNNIFLKQKQNIKLNDDVIFNGNLFVLGKTLFNNLVVSESGIDVRNGISYLKQAISINSNDTDSGTITIGNNSNLTKIILNPLLIAKNQELGFLTIDPLTNIVYISYPIIPIPDDPFQIDILSVNEILNNANKIILINNTPSIGNLSIGNFLNNNIIISGGAIFFDGPIGTNQQHLNFISECIFQNSLTTNKIETNNIVIGNFFLSNNITLNIKESMTLSTKNFLSKNNFSFGNSSSIINFTGSIINIGQNSNNITINFSPLNFLNLPLIENNTYINNYLVLDQTNSSLKSMNLNEGTPILQIDDIETSFINQKTENNTILSAINNVTFTDKIILEGIINSHNPILNINCKAVFAEDVFIGIKTNKNKMINYLKKNILKKEELLKKLNLLNQFLIESGYE